MGVWSSLVTQRRLQHVSLLLAGPYGLDVGGVHQAPKVVGVVAAVQTQAQPHTGNAHHRSDADGGGVAWVTGLQLHAHLEVVGGWEPGLRAGRRWSGGQRSLYCRTPTCSLMTCLCTV